MIESWEPWDMFVKELDKIVEKYDAHGMEREAMVARGIGVAASAVRLAMNGREIQELELQSTARTKE